ncbi:hypothetical protein OIU79_030207 [Salix purpurea]|uniref:Uncharacterized protein n=1 Tax=Salix purpurea TaxID=77065 RepID=A0A9Q0ZW96_SALPP|nr:hypothetical protein OIU79_030207 [Salix purpurea]
MPNFLKAFRNPQQRNPNFLIIKWVKINNFEEHNKLPELKLDAKQTQGFLSFFKTLPHDPRAVRVFDRRGYYTAHADNATLHCKDILPHYNCFAPVGEWI